VPIYDYLCSNCRERTEVIHAMSDPGPRFCPACGAEGTLRKAFAPPAVHFRGSGWAKKDRSSSSKARAKSDSGTDTGAAKSDSSGGESSGSSESGSEKPAASSGSTSGSSSGSSSSDAAAS